MQNMNLLGVTPKQMEAKIRELTTLIANVKKATTVAVSIDEVAEDNRKKEAELKEKLQAALDNYELDEITKLNGELKRVRAKLLENPVEKIQAFDEAVNALVKFAQPVKIEKGNVTDIKTEDKAA